MGRTHAKIITGTSRRGCLCRFREAWGGMADAMASSYTAFANAFGCNVGCYRECNGGLRSHGVFAWVQAGAVILSESATKKKQLLLCMAMEKYSPRGCFTFSALHAWLS